MTEYRYVELTDPSRDEVNEHLAERAAAGWTLLSMSTTTMNLTELRQGLIVSLVWQRTVVGGGAASGAEEQHEQA